MQILHLFDRIAQWHRLVLQEKRKHYSCWPVVIQTAMKAFNHLTQMTRVTLIISSNLLAPCQQLTNTLALGELAKLDRIHIPGDFLWNIESTCEVIRDNFSDSETRMQEIGIMKNDFDASFNLQF